MKKELLTLKTYWNGDSHLRLLEEDGDLLLQVFDASNYREGELYLTAAEVNQIMDTAQKWLDSLEEGK